MAQHRVKKAKRGPLETLLLKSLHVFAHCQMCGADSNKYLEPGFNPSGEPMILCQACRIGSAELLADARRPKTVHVFMEGGLIQNIELPEGVTVKVYDYDIEGVDAERIEKDGKGEECTIAVWSKE